MRHEHRLTHRNIRLIAAVMLALMILVAPVTLAQDAPTATPDTGVVPLPPPPGGEPTAIVPTALAQDVPTAMPDTGVVPLPPPPGGEPTTIAPFPGTNQLSDDMRLLMLARIDLELLVDSQMGAGFRPEAWSGLTDPQHKDMALLLRLDLELFYSTLVSMERPKEWIGAVGSLAVAIARDIRHDLELAADHFLGTERPVGWSGGNPLFRCSRAVQILVQLFMLENLYTSNANPSAPDYCRQLENDLTRYAETNLLQRAELGIFSPPPVIIENAAQVKNNFTVAWLDTRARTRVGVIPNGATVQVLGRSYANFSNMVLVRGEDFTVYIEYLNTTLTADEFRALPDAALVPLVPSCMASWCS